MEITLPIILLVCLVGAFGAWLAYGLRTGIDRPSRIIRLGFAIVFLAAFLARVLQWTTGIEWLWVTVNLVAIPGLVVAAVGLLALLTRGSNQSFAPARANWRP